MELSLFVLGLIAIVAGIALIVATISEDISTDSFIEKLYLLILGLGIIFLGIMAWIAIGKIINNERETSKYEIKTEIRQKIINGKIVSSDTVYIFTPKEK